MTSPAIPSSRAVAAAVSGWSPVIIFTAMPARRHRAMASRASGRGGSSVVLPVSQDGRLDFVVGFHAPEAAAFSEAEQATLEALAELIGLTVRNHFNALASLYVAAEVALDFATLRDFETGGHLNRVSHYSRLIAEGLAERRGLSAHAVDQIARFSLLHDIGKAADHDMEGGHPKIGADLLRRHGLGRYGPPVRRDSLGMRSL